ncbi:glycosyltransferase family 4 protein [Roseateles sp.]|uniref:glycosyltransferase family 4 protein n=1 Tax=Roseateles sp. TaxID=1971397 RepID=UPI002F40E0C8
MRVLALAHQYVPVHCAGAETMLHSMLRALAARGHEVHVTLSAQPGRPYELDGVRVWPHVTSKDVFEHLPKADVLVSHLMNTPRATFLGNWNDIPTVLIHHNTFDVTKAALVTPQARVDLAVVNSQWMADDLAEWFAERGATPPATAIVRPLVDLADYATTPGDRVTLVNMRPMDVDSRGNRMGKGAETFWAAAERMPKTRFLGVRGAYGTQMVRDLPNVEVLDHVPNHEMREKVFARTRVLLMPSSYESWGRVGTEALCSGIPVIAHPTPGLRESLGDAGIFVDRDDVDAWVRALRTLALPQSYGAASARARARAEQLAALDDLDRWCNAVEAVAGRRAR